METYLVGGAVRDQLLGWPVKERDWVVVGTTPQQMLQLGYRKVGKDFPVFIHPETGEEYALARTERKTQQGYTGFECYAAPDVTLEQDLQRRDITINAIAQTVSGNIIDPYGGVHDLQKRLIRHVSVAFVEDPVRILRVARFLARYAHLGFTIAEETMQLMRNMVRAGEVNALVPERVWQELLKALHEAQPQKFIEILRACGALAILFPEINNLFGVPNPPHWHPEIDTGIHTLLALNQISQLSVQGATRFAVLLHDLGKGATPLHEWPKHAGHEERGKTLIKQLCQRYRVPSDYQELALLTAQYHTHCHRASDLTAKTLLKTLEKLDAFRRPDRFHQFLLACEADARGRSGLENSSYPGSQHFKAAHQAAAAISIKPILEQGLQGKAIGNELHQQRIIAIKKFLHKTE